MKTKTAIWCMACAILSICAQALTIERGVQFTNGTQIYTAGYDITLADNVSWSGSRLNFDTYGLDIKQSPLNITILNLSANRMEFNETQAANLNVRHIIYGMTSSQIIKEYLNYKLDGITISNSSGAVDLTVGNLTKANVMLNTSNISCSVSGGASIINQTVYSDSNMSLYVNNSAARSRLSCDFGDISHECDYGASYADQITIPVSASPLTMCNLTVWTNKTTGYGYMRIMQDQDHNDTNIGVNFTKTKYASFYYYYDTFGTTQNETWGFR